MQSKMGNQNTTASVPVEEKTASQVPGVPASNHDQSSSSGGNDAIVHENQASSSAANDQKLSGGSSTENNEASDHDQSSSSVGNEVNVLENQPRSLAASDHDLSGGSSPVIKEASDSTKGEENDEATAEPSNIDSTNEDTAAKPNDSAGGCSLDGEAFNDTCSKETTSSKSNPNENQQSESFGTEEEQIHEISQVVLHVKSNQPAEVDETSSTVPSQNGSLLEYLHDVEEPQGTILTPHGIEENGETGETIYEGHDSHATPDHPQKIDDAGTTDCLLDATSAGDWIGSSDDMKRDGEPLIPAMLKSTSVLHAEEMEEQEEKEELVQTISGKEIISELQNIKHHTSDPDHHWLQPISNGHETESISEKEVKETGFHVELGSDIVVDASQAQLLEPTNNTPSPLQHAQKRIEEPLGTILIPHGIEENGETINEGLDSHTTPDHPQKIDDIGSTDCLLDATSAGDRIGSSDGIKRDGEPLIPVMLKSKSVLHSEEMEQEEAAEQEEEEELVQTISGKEIMSELKNIKDHTSDPEQHWLQPISNGHETESISETKVKENGFHIELGSDIVVDASQAQLLEPTNNTAIPLQQTEERILVSEDKLNDAENKSGINQVNKADDVGDALEAKMMPNGQMEKEETSGHNGDDIAPSSDAGITVKLENNGRWDNGFLADVGSCPMEASVTGNGSNECDRELQGALRQKNLEGMAENGEELYETSSYDGKREGEAAYDTVNVQLQMNHDLNMEGIETVDNQLTSCKEPIKTAAVQSHIPKYPSFNFDIMNIEARISEESDQTPLLYPSVKPHPRVVRSLSSPAVNPNLIINKEYLTAYQDISVEEKTIIVEKSDSENSKTPLLSFVDKEEEEVSSVRERHDQNQCSLVGESEERMHNNASSSNKESTMMRKEGDKRKPRSSTSSFFSSCICCAGVSQLNSDY